MSGGYIAFGRCWSCGASLTFNPDLVPSVFVDPVTGRPPDLDVHSRMIEPSDDALARAVRAPLCPDCVEIANARRTAAGLRPIVVLPGAYEASETL
jgi:hypothetical protein